MKKTKKEIRKAFDGVPLKSKEQVLGSVTGYTEKKAERGTSNRKVLAFGICFAVLAVVLAVGLPLLRVGGRSKPEIVLAESPLLINVYAETDFGAVQRTEMKLNNVLNVKNGNDGIGIGFELIYAGCAIEAETDGGVLLVHEDKAVREVGQKYLFETQGELFWVPTDGDGHCIRVVIRENGNVVGLALIRIWKSESGEFFASLEKSVGIPLVDGKHQKIDDGYLLEFFGNGGKPTEAESAEESADESSRSEETETVLRQVLVVPGDVDSLGYTFTPVGNRPIRWHIEDIGLLRDMDGNFYRMNDRGVADLTHGNILSDFGTQAPSEWQGKDKGKTLDVFCRGGELYLLTGKGLVITVGTADGKTDFIRLPYGDKDALLGRFMDADGYEEPVVWLYGQDGRSAYLSLDGKEIASEEIISGAGSVSLEKGESKVVCRFRKQDGRLFERIFVDPYIVKHGKGSFFAVSHWDDNEKRELGKTVTADNGMPFTTYYDCTLDVGDKHFEGVVDYKFFFGENRKLYIAVGFIDRLEIYRMHPGKTEQDAAELAEGLVGTLHSYDEPASVVIGDPGILNK